ncbi:MAG: arginine-tRNA-protein transferase, partial [Bacteroidota bacterium]
MNTPPDDTPWHTAHYQWVPPILLDQLLADGWRHFGHCFFRDQLNSYQGKMVRVLPLRIRLADFTFKKSQKKIIKKNSHSRVVIREVCIDATKHALFHKHKQRFKDNVPDSLYDFLSPQPALLPTHMVECCLYEQDELYAVSFLDIGQQAVSSVYAIFNPAYGALSPGIYTLLVEIQYALKLQKEYLYLGYAHEGTSFYDYKKGFN